MTPQEAKRLVESLPGFNAGYLKAMTDVCAVLGSYMQTTDDHMESELLCGAMTAILALSQRKLPPA